MTDQGQANTDRVLWQDVTNDDVLFVTQSGGIGMNVGGRVYVRPIKDWHSMARTFSPIDSVELANAIVATQMVPGIFRGPKRWSWALDRAEKLAKRLADR